MAKKEFKTQSKQLLELMIHSIYSNKEIFLRELISNASDALTKRHFNYLKGLTKLNPDLEIKLEIDKDNRLLKIIDNGLGMNEEDLDNFLGTIANSGTKAFMENTLKKENENVEDINAIGQFGVGFYSAYLVADEVQVITTKENSPSFLWKSDGVSSYEISKTDDNLVGTTVILHIKEGEEYDKFLDSDVIESLVKKHSDFISHPIFMDKDIKTNEESEDKTETKIVKTRINSQKAIWKKEKSEVTKEDYDSFYKSSFGDFMDPLFSFNANVEGTLDFSLLAYIPAKNPYMNMMGEVKNTFKLYSKEVLIDDDASYLLPDYLKFLRGIVDCSDLNLNISREMLQQDNVVKKLKTTIEKRIVKELTKLMKTNFEKYIEIFTNYSREITFGVYNDFGSKKELLKDLLLFKSNKKNEYISLKTYVENNKDAKQILYVVGTNIDVINKMPVMEQFDENSQEVLYFLNDVDEFAIKTLNQYDGKEFSSVSNFKQDDKPKSQKIATEEENNKKLIDTLKEELKEEIEDVVFTDKLKTSLVKLSSKNEVSIEMEKNLQDNPEASHIKAQKVLEININHKIYDKLKNLTQEETKLYAKVLLDQAKLVEGLEINDPIEFVKNINKLLEK